MTLSLYVGGSKVKQVSLPATADWNTWATETETVTLAAGANSLAYRFDSTDTGNVNLDSITLDTTGGAGGSPSPSPSASSSSTPPPSGQLYEAETAFTTGGPALATSLAGYTGSGYLTGFSSGARATVTVAAPTTGSYPLTLRYANATGATRTLSLYLDGIRNQQLSLPTGSGWLTVTQNVPLRSGINLIGLQADSADNGSGVALDDLTVTGGSALAATGATLPYTEYPAASAQTNGTVLAPSRSYPSLQAEATARQPVQLTATGQYLQITLTKPANALTVRYSIPGNPDGSTATAPLALYANGTKLQDLTLTSQYSWLYGGGYYDTRNPSSGPAHHFYDEVHALIGDWPAGTVLKLQKDAADTAASYTLDVLDTEQVDPAPTMPAGFVSVTNYGVTPDSSADATNTVNTALAALSGTGTGLWFPPGTYLISGRINLGSVAVRGAGPWRTVLKSTAENGSGGLYSTGGVVQIADLSILGDQTSRNNDSGAAGIEGSFAAGSLISDVWIEHTKVGIWAVPGTGLHISGVRVRDVFADGIHVHGGSTGSASTSARYATPATTRSPSTPKAAPSPAATSPTTPSPHRSRRTASASTAARTTPFAPTGSATPSPSAPASPSATPTVPASPAPPPCRGTC
ncbi:carbohydrate-binding protein [Streptacidiphilus monticola]